jgi:putative FmdB family regulatory protein
MPLYEYKCGSCGEIFEVIQKFSDAPLDIHEKCGGRLERLVSPSALRFKGSGWYVNDYAGSGNGKQKPEKAAKKETSSSSESTAKPETKASDSPASSSDKKK